MTRAEKVRQARELRAQGLTVREIAERLHVGRATAGDYLTDPDLSKHRDRRYRRAGACIDCGAPTDASRREPNKRCAACSKIASAERQRAAWAPHREHIERLWAEGKTAREIGTILGWDLKHPGTRISQLRGRGYNLPHRRTPEQIARITADAGVHLRYARAVYRLRRDAA